MMNQVVDRYACNTPLELLIITSFMISQRSPIISTPIFKLVRFANSVMIETVSVVTGPYANVKQRSLS